MRPLSILVLSIAATVALAVTAGDTGDAAWPGGNGRIFYARSGAGIWSMAPDGSDRTQLTTGPDFFPSASPDGSKVAFERTNQVWVMNADGSGQQMIAPGNTPSWSPDGERIVFTRSGRVMEMDADGGNEETLTTDTGVTDSYPVYQPGGDLIALLRVHNSAPSGGPNPTPDIYLMDASGLVEPVTETTGYHEGPPDWSPDGTRLVFRQFGHIVTWQLGGMDPPEAILAYGDVLLQPAWSPDGAKIVFARGAPVAFRRGSATPQGTPPQFLQIWTMNADGSDPQVVPGAATMTFESAPDWSVPYSPPPIELVQGDNDCDGDSDAVDALVTLQSVAALPYNQQPDCPGLGSAVPAGAEPQLFGDIDCDGDVDAVDALQVLRHVAGFSVNQEPGCPEIGEPL